MGSGSERTPQGSRPIHFEEIILAIEEGGLKDILIKPNQRRYRGQLVLVAGLAPSDLQPARAGSGMCPWDASRILPKIGNLYIVSSMSTMNISLPDSLKSFVDEQVKQRGYGTSSEYVRDLIRKDQERTRLRDLLLEGAASQPIGAADRKYFDGLRNRIRRRAKR